MKQKPWPQIFIIYTRYLIGFAFIYASLVKIQGLRFTYDSGADNAINTAWHFFETLYESGLYWRFIGIAQFISGALLITQRYAKLGAVLFLPIITNVFIITISYDFNGTPIITGLMLLATLLLIGWDWDSLKILINKKSTASDQKRFEHDSIWIILGIVFLVISVSAKLLVPEEKLLTLLLLLPLIGIIGLAIAYNRKELY